MIFKMLYAPWRKKYVTRVHDRREGDPHKDDTFKLIMADGDDAALILAANSIFGWVRSTIGPTQISDRRMSFISFSTDPTFTEEPPLPAEVLDQDTAIIPPTVVVDPLQDDWVGLVGSAFETF